MVEREGMLSISVPVVLAKIPIQADLDQNYPTSSTHPPTLPPSQISAIKPTVNTSYVDPSK